MLDLDFSRANTLPDDYDTDVESAWANPSKESDFTQMAMMTVDIFEDLFADGNDFSWATIVKGRNAYYQKQMADRVLSQAEETTSLLTDALNIHLNIGQNFTVNSSSTFLALRKVSMGSLSRQLLTQAAGGQVSLPSSLNSNLTSNSPVSSRVRCPSSLRMDTITYPILVDHEQASRRRSKCHGAQHQRVAIDLLLDSGSRWQ